MASSPTLILAGSLIPSCLQSQLQCVAQSKHRAHSPLSQVLQWTRDEGSPGTLTVSGLAHLCFLYQGQLYCCPSEEQGQLALPTIASGKKDEGITSKPTTACSCHLPAAVLGGVGPVQHSRSGHGGGDTGEPALPFMCCEVVWAQG